MIWTSSGARLVTLGELIAGRVVAPDAVALVRDALREGASVAVSGPAKVGCSTLLGGLCELLIRSRRHLVLSEVPSLARVGFAPLDGADEDAVDAVDGHVVADGLVDAADVDALEAATHLWSRPFLVAVRAGSDADEMLRGRAQVELLMTRRGGPRRVSAVLVGGSRVFASDVGSDTGVVVHSRVAPEVPSPALVSDSPQLRTSPPPPASSPRASADGSLVLGSDASRNPLVVDADAVAGHGLLFGVTGSGVSATLERVVSGLAASRRRGVVLDLTASAPLRAHCAKVASSLGVPLFEVGCDDPTLRPFDVFAHLDSTSACEVALASTRFDDDYWRVVVRRVTGRLLDVMFACHEAFPDKFPRPTLSQLQRVLASPSLPAGTKRLRAAHAMVHPDTDGRFLDALARPTQDEQRAAMGLAAAFENVLSARGGHVLDCGSGPAVSAVEDGLVYIGVDARVYPKLALMLHAAVCSQPSAWAFNRLRHQVLPSGDEVELPEQFVVITDANVGERQFVYRLLSHGRPQRIAAVLVSPSPADFTLANDGTSFDALVRNTAWLAAHRVDPLGARVLADRLGRDAGELTQLPRGVALVHTHGGKVVRTRELVPPRQ